LVEAPTPKVYPLGYMAVPVPSSPPTAAISAQQRRAAARQALALLDAGREMTDPEVVGAVRLLSEHPALKLVCGGCGAGLGFAAVSPYLGSGYGAALILGRWLNKPKQRPGGWQDLDRASLFKGQTFVDGRYEPSPDRALSSANAVHHPGMHVRSLRCHHCGARYSLKARTLLMHWLSAVEHDEREVRL